MSIESQFDAAEAVAEELKAPATFDAREAAKGATYPKDKVDVYSNAELAHELNMVAGDAAAARFNADLIKQKFMAEGSSRTIEEGPTDAPGWWAADEEASKLEAKVARLVGELQKTVLTFHMRGLAPAQFRLIAAKWRKEIKPPARKNYPQTEDGEEEFLNDTYERDIERNAGINNEQIASGIFKVVRKHDGAENTDVWKHKDVAVLNDTYLESEYEKLRQLVVHLTFANNLFQIAVQQDADFLSKP